MKGLTGKNVLITGASSGIGQSIAIRLAQEGCNIAINYRKNTEEAAYITGQTLYIDGGLTLSADFRESWSA